jgi:hypothetical protein
MIRGMSLSSISRFALGSFSMLFFAFGAFFLFTSEYEINFFSKTLYYAILTFAYLICNMTYVNSSYRYVLLSKKIGGHKIEKEITAILEKIKKKFGNKEKAIDLLSYYLKDALVSFEEGDYENAFLSGYKIINEPTVIKPIEYVTDKRDGLPSRFSEIRTALMHSSRDKHKIEVTTIKKTKSKLPYYSLEVIERATELLHTITKDVD